MTMKIIIKDKKGKNCFDYFVHEDHENDMYDFLKNHNSIPVSNITSKKEGIDWFTFILTSNDVKMIKQTSWYFNHKIGNEHLTDEIIQGATIEVFLVEYIPPKEKE